MSRSKTFLFAMLAAAAVACGSTNTNTSGSDAGGDAATGPEGDAGASAWSQTGLDGANIVPTIAIDPKNPSTVFAGISAGSAEMGIFRTKDGGKNWTKLAGGLPDRYAGIVTIHPENGTLLVNPGVEGIWRSVDGGDTFTQAAADPGGVNALLFHPTANVAWAVTSQRGCFRSDDGGLTWTERPNTGLPLNQFGLGPLAFDGSKLYLGTGGQGVYVSTDDGDSWAHAASAGLPDGSGGGDVLNLVATPSRPGVLFVQTNAAGIFRSLDEGATFTKLAPGGAGTRYPALHFAPSSPKTIFVSANENQGGAGGLFESTDDGESWTNVGPSAVPVSSIDVAPDGTVFTGTIGQGVYRFGR